MATVISHSSHAHVSEGNDECSWRLTTPNAWRGARSGLPFPAPLALRGRSSTRSGCDSGCRTWKANAVGEPLVSRGHGSNVFPRRAAT